MNLLKSEKQKRYFLYFLIALSTIPFIFFVNLPETWALTSQNIKSLALYVSAVLGYVGVSLIMWEFILGTRSVTGLYFKDLPQLLKVHSWLGKYGTILIFLHPLLVTISYGESLLYSFTLNFSSTFNSAVSWGRLSFFALIIVWVTSALVRGKISFRPWKYIHYLAYLSIPFVLLHVPDTGSSFSNTFIQFYWYSVVILFIIFGALRLRHVFGYGKLKYKIVAQTQIKPDVFNLQLAPATKSITIKQGQYIYIQKSLLSEEHPFTVLDSNSKTGEILVAYKVFGSYTKKLSNLKASDYVNIDGPYGVFTSQLLIEPIKKTVFIAGGIGITPFVKYIIKQPISADYWLFYANKHKNKAPFRDILKSCLQNKYIDIISQDKDAPISNEQRGHICKEHIAKYINNPAEYNYYICGASGMMDSAQRALKELKVPKKQIFIEDFSF
ncbi:ferric reductase-like transmembrane domain-containing protein [Candidatus Saccharibacteria bacterium]|nr:ferric reductase-like transmembrane domain-containing protein [Candidatus Saccharibacteria bacterium]MDQ5953455.1 Ferric reductase-like transrane protein [Patescibacteria group bacterium]